MTRKLEVETRLTSKYCILLEMKLFEFDFVVGTETISSSVLLESIHGRFWLLLAVEKCLRLPKKNYLAMHYVNKVATICQLFLTVFTWIFLFCKSHVLKFLEWGDKSCCHNEHCRQSSKPARSARIWIPARAVAIRLEPAVHGRSEEDRWTTTQGIRNGTGGDSTNMLGQIPTWSLNFLLFNFSLFSALVFVSLRAVPMLKADASTSFLTAWSPRIVV